MSEQFLAQLGPVVGIGVTAFPRVGVAPLLPDYQILAIQETQDLVAMRHKVIVKTIKGDFKGRVKKLNTLSVLQDKTIQTYLLRMSPKPAVFVYKSSKRIEKICDQLGVVVLGNKAIVRDPYEDKWTFRQLAAAAGIAVIPGEQMLIDDLSEEKFAALQQSFGEKLVLQITDYTKGGGIGTFFVESVDDLTEFHGYVMRRRGAERDLKRVNVTKRIEGESASITGCVTKYGVLTSLVQRQIVDVHEVIGYAGRNGVFCGHDWGERYSEGIHAVAKKLVTSVGEMMGREGYKGIFGIDLVVNRETNEVSLVECNPRYTACFPVYTMMQANNGEMPMDVWHLLEHAGVDYSMDFAAVQASYDQVKWGAQLILHNLERGAAILKGDVAAGVYRFEGERLTYLRPGFSYADLEADNEFVLADGVPVHNARLKIGARMGRVMFKRPVLAENSDVLQPEIHQAMLALYRLYGLRKIGKKKV